MIKNYTSTVPASRSVNRIEDRLVKGGAQDILKIYEDKKLKGIAFTIDVEGKKMPFKLPARVEKVEKKLKSAVKRPQQGTYKNIEAQAERTAWKILSDWVDIQMSLIELDQAEFLEIFLPYSFNYSTNQTLFEKFKKDGFKQLTYNG